MRIFIAIIQSVLFIVSSFAVKDSNFKYWVDREAIDMASTSDVSFAAVTADELKVSESEKESCRQWYENHVLGTDEPAYNFNYGIKSFADNTDEWEYSASQESEKGAVYKGGKTTYITLTHNNGLVATVEATIYEDFATCEWTVSLKNTADEDSPVIKSFCGADCVVPAERSKLYFSRGSEPAADDFEMLETALTVLPMKFSANGGRSESALPYFNVCGKENGFVFGVGWSGQWYASIAQKISGAEIVAKQEVLNGKLHAGEEIRSPLVSLTFYNGNNALKGFNTFRNWTLNCVYPEGTKGITTCGLGNEFSTTTSDTMIESIKNSPVEFTDKIDAYWIDAGWYVITNTNWGDSVGTWKADPNRYPDGLAAVSEAAAERGVRLLVWYEPERCSKGTEVYNECIKHEGWLIEQNDERNMVNFANEETLEYITDVILESIRFNGVGVLRTDCIPAPYPFWEKADEMWENGRKGFTENHYVTNLYAFFDTLLEEVPGLMIDNCCSGGKRIDIEMSRRSIPLWRSDYNCGDAEGNVKEDIVEATQCFTYGLAFWLPYSGATAYVSGEYADRTNILPCAQQVGYEDIRAYMDDNYYPLTYGGLDLTKYHAMQYGSDAEGAAIIYKRENVTDDNYTLILNGLDPDKTYVYYDYDDPDVKLEKTGEELMTNGIKLNITETPKAVIICYAAK